jgi:hypothetical protein
VAGPQSSHDCAARKSDNGENPSFASASDGINAEALRGITLSVRRRAYAGSHTRSQCAADRRVAQTMLIFHELNAANVLSLDDLLA